MTPPTTSQPSTAPTWGIWFIGARGSVATTATTGALSIGRGLADTQGMVTELQAFDGVALPELDQLVIGGWDTADDPLPKRAVQLADSRVIPGHLPAAVEDGLEAADRRILPGVSVEDARTRPGDALERLVNDLRAFAAGLDTVIVVNVASTEPPMPHHPSHEGADTLRAAVAAGQAVLSPGGLYAMAALQAGLPYVDFTPGSATTLPGLQELARRRRVPIAGRDGKTGETLLKTALAPMFADRALRVRSWSGMNLLGGGDGQTLADPVAASSKLASKAEPLEAILGYTPEGPVRIDHVADLGDWKTAWDLITFEGFLGTGMQLQFTWQGCDSALAAPLVLDLARLLATATAAGHAGPQPALGYFFKAPIDSDEHRLQTQFLDLVAWAQTLG